VGQHADVVALHYDPGELPWLDLVEGRPSTKLRSMLESDAKLSAARSTFVAITPFNQHRCEVAGLEGGAPFPVELGPALFSNPRVRKAYANYVGIVVAHLQPRFLALGIEVNQYEAANPADFGYWVSLYKELYRELKRVSPELVVFVSFQLDELHSRSQMGILKHFLPELDRVGISLYPSVQGLTPDELPVDYIAAVLDFAQVPIVVTESAYSSRPYRDDVLSLPGSPELQRDYLDWLLVQSEQLPIEFVNWFFATDTPFLIDNPNVAGGEVFAFMGLTTRGFGSKPVFELWKATLQRPILLTGTPR
jgi:hypothetical protein